MANEIADFYRQIPPVTRCLVTVAGGIWLATLLQLVNPTLLVNVWSYTLWKGQLWRPFTAFLFPVGDALSGAMQIYSLYNFSNQLETSKFVQVADYVFYLIIVCTTILVGTSPFSTLPIYLNGLIIALTYTSSQEAPERPARFFFISVKAKYLPLMAIALGYLQSGQFIVEVAGYAAGHLFLFFDTIWPARGGSRYLQTPQFLKTLLPQSSSAATARGYTVYPGHQDQQANTNANRAGGDGGGGSAWSSAFQGRGHRLGSG